MPNPKCFFDITADGAPMGRIIMEVSVLSVCVCVGVGRAGCLVGRAGALCRHFAGLLAWREPVFNKRPHRTPRPQLSLYVSGIAQISTNLPRSAQYIYTEYCPSPGRWRSPRILNLRLGKLITLTGECSRFLIRKRCVRSQSRGFLEPNIITTRDCHPKSSI